MGTPWHHTHPTPADVPLYCTSIQEVQAAMRTYKSARFKPFASREEAERFSRLPAGGSEAAGQPSAPSPSAGGEKPSPFKNPTRHDVQVGSSL